MTAKIILPIGENSKTTSEVRRAIVQVHLGSLGNMRTNPGLEGATDMEV